MNTWKLETSVAPIQGGAIVTARGRISARTAGQFAQALRQAGHGARRVVVDLAGVDYISGEGISALLEAADGAETMIVCGLGEAMRNTLDLAGLNGRVRIEETREAAISMCRG